MKRIRGSEMRPEVQEDAKRRFVHRHTREHVPAWYTKNDWTSVQFESDADWLANTFFWVRDDGGLANNKKYCESHPTWPDGCRLGPLRVGLPTPEETALYMDCLVDKRSNLTGVD
jgi:hypothetical protein